MPALLNNTLFNGSLFNGEVSTGVNPSDDIVFAGYGLQNPNIISSIADDDNASQKDITKNNNPREDGQKIETANYRTKTIPVKGVIIKPSIAELESEIDRMKKYLATESGLLEIANSLGVRRRYIANVVNFDSIFSRANGDLTRAPFLIHFECLESFGKSETRQVTSAIGVTLAEKSYELYNSGSYKAKPIFYLAFDAVEDVSKVNIKNNTTGKEIEIERSFSAGELLEVDCETKEVNVDGVAVDFDGFFFDLETGANSITITITSTSHNYTLTNKFYKTYL